MKLEGSLDAFGLPDIFQLLSLTRKTGGLHLRGGTSAGVVYFADGAVTGADANLTRQTLARRLVGTGTVSDDAVAAAVERAQADGVGVGRALLDAGAVDAEVVREAAAEVAGDAVFDLLSWPEGDFAFSPDAVNPDDVGLHLATERVVSEAASRQQALDSASDVIGSGDVVLSLAAAPAHDPQLSRADWALVALADGRRSVADIVDLTGQSYYAVVPSLAALVRHGLLEVRGEHPDHVTEVRRQLDLLAVLEGGSHGSAHDTTVADAAAAAAVPGSASSAVHVPAPAAARTAATASAPLRAATVAAQPQPVVALEDAGAEGSRQPAEAVHVEAVEPAAAASNDLVATIGGPHVPENVVPPRPEPILARRQPEHPEGDHVPVAPAAAAPAAAAASSRPAFGPPAAAGTARPTSGSVFSQPPGTAAAAAGAPGGVGAVHGSAAMAADPEVAALIERDPSVNRSLLLRLIAGVRGL